MDINLKTMNPDTMSDDYLNTVCSHVIENHWQLTQRCADPVNTVVQLEGTLVEQRNALWKIRTAAIHAPRFPKRRRIVIDGPKPAVEQAARSMERPSRPVNLSIRRTARPKGQDRPYGRVRRGEKALAAAAA